MLMTCEQWDPVRAAECCRKFCTFYASLNKNSYTKGDDLLWRVKPKFHLFSELAEFQAPLLGNPSMYWNYMDEDFVGWIAQLAASKGGPKAAATTARKTIERYMALESL